MDPMFRILAVWCCCVALVACGDPGGEGDGGVADSSPGAADSSPGAADGAAIDGAPGGGPSDGGPADAPEAGPFDAASVDAEPGCVPAALEECDGDDDTCDAVIDEGCCGNGACDVGELGVCPDCGYCGDSACQPELGEDTFTCVADCEFEFCGNGNCGAGEEPQGCPYDCCGVFSEVCGDGVDNDCNGQTDEVCCGDGTCDWFSESYGTCADCGSCGDTFCDGSYEDAVSCPDDCL